MAVHVRPTNPSRDRWRAPLLALLLAAAVFCIYFQLRHYGFIDYDDPEFVVHNPHLRGGLTPASILWAFRSTYAANWFPLTWLSYMAEENLFGADAGWRHLTNLLLHAINSVLLFAVLWRMTGARWRSFWAAAVFALHPLHVEAVAWISERRELLSGLFWFLAMAAYVRWVERPGAGRYVLLVAAFACGLMSKPMIVTLPFVLLLLDWWPLGRWPTAGARRLLLEKAPLAAMAAAGSMATLLVQQGGGAVSSLAEAPLGLRLENAAVSYLAYLWQFFWPARLAVLYPYASGLPLWHIAGAAAILAGITALAIWQRRRRPALAVGWFWFAGTLVPVIGLVQVGIQGRADRYMYIPLAGLTLAGAWGAAEIAGRFPRLRSAIAAAGAAACCAYGVAAWSAASYWDNTVHLFRHAVEDTHDNWGALTVLSHTLLEENRVDEALPYIAETLRLRPQLAEAHINYAAALDKRRDLNRAADEYRIALHADPENPDAQEGLGVVLTEKGQFPEALSHLTAAETAHPESPDVHYNLGRFYGEVGRAELAAEEFLETVRLEPENAQAHYNLGAAYAAQERFPEARDQFKEAVRLEPDYTAAHFNLGSALANLERFDDAIVQFQEVLRLQPDSSAAAEAIQNCLQLKQQTGR